ncbi:MAG: hypothetical protein ACQEVA_00695 [Myxococcota bacterium]
MAYKAQLVVRTRDKQGAETIERVKELAEEQGKSFSEMAIELLDRGIGAPEGGAAPAAPPTEIEAKSEPVGEVKPKPEPVEPEPVVEEKKPEPVDLGPAPPVGEAADDVEDALDDDGIEAAAEAMAEYFAVAGAVEGGKIKKELQKRLTAANYEEIMEIVKQSDQYRSYKDRVLFGT